MIIEFAALAHIVVAIVVVVLVVFAVAVVRLLEHSLYGWGKANNGPTEYKYYQAALFPSCLLLLQLVFCLLFGHAKVKKKKI